MLPKKRWTLTLLISITALTILFHSEYLSRLLVLTANVSQLILAKHILITHLCLRFILFFFIKSQYSYHAYVPPFLVWMCVNFVSQLLFFLLFYDFSFPAKLELSATTWEMEPIASFQEIHPYHTAQYHSLYSTITYGTITYSTKPQHNSQCCLIFLYISFVLQRGIPCEKKDKSYWSVL